MTNQEIESVGKGLTRNLTTDKKNEKLILPYGVKKEYANRYNTSTSTCGRILTDYLKSNEKQQQQKEKKDKNQKKKRNKSRNNELEQENKNLKQELCKLRMTTLEMMNQQIKSSINSKQIKLTNESQQCYVNVSLQMLIIVLEEYFLFMKVLKNHTSTIIYINDNEYLLSLMTISTQKNCDEETVSNNVETIKKEINVSLGIDTSKPGSLSNAYSELHRHIRRTSLEMFPDMKEVMRKKYDTLVYIKEKTKYICDICDDTLSEEIKYIYDTMYINVATCNSKNIVKLHEMINHDHEMQNKNKELRTMICIKCKKKNKSKI